MRSLFKRSATVASAARVAGSSRRHQSDAPTTTEGGEGKVTMSMYEAINQAMRLSMERDEKVYCFGEDVGFGGVFRCSVGLQEKFGHDRVFSTPLSEQGIAGFAIGMATTGLKPVAEIQFSDYIFPAFDQIVNEAAKFRYRSGGHFHCGGLTIRSPCSSVGHGGLYHSQSGEAYFAHTPGLKIATPSNPEDAKGLLLSCIEDNNPCLFFEPKILYRKSVAEIPEGYYTTPLGQARIVQAGTDLTMVTYGSQVVIAEAAVDILREEYGVSVELIDLRTLVPWDRQTVADSVKKTGRVIVTHEAPITCGYGAEIVASITTDCFLSLEAPPKRVCGLDTPHPLQHEILYLPNKLKLVDAVLEAVNY